LHLVGILFPHINKLTVD